MLSASSRNSRPWSPWSPELWVREEGGRGPAGSILRIVQGWWIDETTDVGAYKGKAAEAETLVMTLAIQRVIPGGDVVAGPDRGISAEYRRRWSGDDKGAIG